MKKVAERDEFQKDTVLRKCFKALTEKGIEGATIRNFSDATGMTASSLYYWFEDKDDIVIDAAVFGLNYIVEILFDYAIKHIGNVDELCDGFVDYVEDYKDQMRLIFQVASSPVYGEKMRVHIKKISLLSDVYTKRISAYFELPHETLRALVDCFISAIADYIIWEDSAKVKRQMSYIARVVKGDEKI